MNLTTEQMLALYVKAQERQAARDLKKAARLGKRAAQPGVLSLDENLRWDRLRARLAAVRETPQA